MFIYYEPKYDRYGVHRAVFRCIPTFRSLAPPRCVLGTSSLHFRKLQKILKRFKKIMQKSWNFLIENRFWKKNEKFSKFLKNLEKSRKISKIGKSKNRKVGFQLEFSSIFRDFRCRKFSIFFKNIFFKVILKKLYSIDFQNFGTWWKQRSSAFTRS